MTKWINDPDISQYLQVEPPVTEKSELEWVRNVHESDNDQVFGIVEKNTNSYIGNVGIHNIDKKSGVATIGIFIGDKTKQGKGYGGEAIELAASFAFGQLGLQKLQAPIFSFNERSIATFERAGFKKEVTLPKHYLKKTEYQDVVLLDRHSPRFDH